MLELCTIIREQFELKSEVLQPKCGHSADRLFVLGSMIMKKILGIIVLGFFLSANLLADDYTISENSTSTNGENTIDGSDSLTLNSGITITTSGANEGIDASGGDNTINQLGNISTTGNSGYGIRLQGDSNTLDILGTITTAGVEAYAIYLRSSDSNTITQSGKVKTTNYTSRLYMIENSENNNITQSGDLESTGVKWSHGYYLDNADTNTITQTGNITTEGTSARSHGYFFDDVSDASGSDNNTITQKGDITLTENNNKGYYFESGDSNSITQSGTITTSGTNGHGYHFFSNSDNNTITLTGAISVSGTNAKVIKVESGNDNNTLVLSEEPTITGSLDLGSEDFIISLSCNLKKDLTIEIENKTNMSVTDNLCGNDRYEILDSSSNADADNSETDGYLRIYGEDLDIDSHNKKYRTEIFLSKLKNIFNTVSDDKEETAFDSNQKRNGIYKNDLSGVVGYFDQNEKIDNASNNLFMGYAKQDATFDNGEFSGTKNIVLGYKKDIEVKKFKGSIIPIVGLSYNNFIDLETEANQTKEKKNYSQFAGVNSTVEKQKIFNENNSLTLEIESTFGIHRLPQYVTNFTEGDLSVDDAIDQVLSVGFSAKYSKIFKNGFVLEPYAGVSYNNTLSNDVTIIADEENKEAGHVMNGVLAKHAGLSLTKHSDKISFSLNYEHGDLNGLRENTFGISFSKKLQKIIKENDKLKLLAEEVLKENAVKDELIIQLIKENQKLKNENKIFKKNLD